MAATLERVVAPVEVDASERPASTARRVFAIALLLVPAAIILWCGWRHRWTADDGFINLRIVRQVVEGHGPVFNVGQRVETGTSPAWIAVLSVLDVLTPIRLEWLAVVTGLCSTTGALVLAVFGTRRALLAIGVTGTFVPLGALVYAVLPPAWDYATSGLEVGLSLLWLALCWWFLAGRIGRTDRIAWYVPVVIGLGPIVRPDFVVFSAAFLVALVVLGGRAQLGRILAWAVAFPIVVELARMVYFANLVPNTAIAKEASLSNWTQGARYLLDFVGSYSVVVPLLTLAIVGVVELRARRWSAIRPFALPALIVVIGAGVHALYVVKVGGDFMHARLLLPACFAALLPVGVVVLRGRAWLGAFVVALWALLCLFVLRPSYSGPSAEHGPKSSVDAVSRATGISDERLFYMRRSSQAHPVTIDDYLRGGDVTAQVGHEMKELAARAKRPMLVLRAPLPSRSVVPIRAGASDRTVASTEMIGVFAYAAGTDVDVIDDHGLADVVAAHHRIKAKRGRPGHEKVLPDVWAFARYAAPGAVLPRNMTEREVAAARRALSCDGLHQLLEHTTGPWSLTDAVGNSVAAVETFSLRYSKDPIVAERELCGRSG